MVEENKSGAYSQFVYAPTGQKIEIMNGQSYVKSFVPLPGGAVAVYTPSVNYYRHPDHLGSSRFASTSTRTMYSDVAYAPFGEPYAQAGATDVSFTGQNQDTVSNLYDFPAREYGIQGRWPSPDPAGLAAADLTDPQSWNRFSYVRNSPLNSIDPLGLTDCPQDKTCWDQGQSLGDVLGSSNFWDGRPSIGFGGTTHQFDLLTIPVTSGPRYGWRLTFSSGPSLTEDINGVPGLPDGNYQVTSSIGGWSWGLLPETVVGNGFDQVGMDIWHNTPQCPNCAHIWNGANNWVKVGTAVVAVEAAPVVGIEGAAALGPDGAIFGTRFMGNEPLLNASDNLRIGWSYIRSTGEYVFRIGGRWLEPYMDNPHINLWPPSWWGGPPGP